MKILLLTDRMDIGGAETHILTLCDELLKMGCNITLITSGGIYTNDLYHRSVAIRIAPLDKRDPLSISRSFKEVRSAMQECDIVHAHTRFCAFLCVKARGHSTYPPIVTTAHLNFPTFPFGPLTKWGDLTLAVSKDIQEHLQKKYFVKAENILLTKNGINKKLYSIERKRHNIIIHTSRIDKGRASTAFSLAECAPTLLGEFPEWRIVIAGDGNRFPKLKAKCDEANKKLGFCGIILLGKRNDIPSILAYGKIFVGVSRAALEGMAAGLATIISGDEGYAGIISKSLIKPLLYNNFCARSSEQLESDKLITDLRTLITDERSAASAIMIGKYIIDKYFDPCSMANDAHLAYKSVLRAPRVALVGYFGYGNLGDEESLRCAVMLLNGLGINNISILYKSGSTPPNNATAFDRMSMDKINECIKNSDTIVFCGGNLLQNETSTRSLIYYDMIAETAKRESKRIYFISSGIGSITGVFGRRLAKRSLRSASFLGMRTEYDLSYATRLSFTRAAIMPDLCFLLNDGKARKTQTSFAWFASSKRALNKNAINKIAKERGLKPIVILLFPSADSTSYDEDNDFAVYTPRNYSTLNNLLAECEFTVSERLHGGIFSIISHTPCYLFGDCEKNRALINEVERRLPEKEKNILLPYSMTAIVTKKEIGAKDSDFKNLIIQLKSEIEGIAIKLFQQS